MVPNTNSLFGCERVGNVAVLALPVQIDTVMKELRLKKEHLDPITVRTLMYGFRGQLADEHPRMSYPDTVIEYMIWSSEIPNLLHYCLNTDADIVAAESEDLIRESIWVHRAVIAFLKEFTPEMRAACDMLPMTEDEVADDMVLMRFHLVDVLVHPKINQLPEALREIEITVQEHKDYLRLINSPNRQTPWKDFGRLYFEFAQVRVLANRLDMETKVALENSLDELGSVRSNDRAIDLHVILVRAGLALVLHALQIEETKQKEHTKWTAQQLRKQPQLKEQVSRYLIRSHPPVHPVFAALGEAWFHRVHSPAAPETQRLPRACHNCGLEENLARVLRACTGCRTILYCASQKSRTKVQTLVAEGLLTANVSQHTQIADRWITTNSYYANHAALIHALSLSQDVTRARTHMVYRILKVDPKRSRTEDKVYLAKCGVFKLEDILKDLAALVRRDVLDQILRNMSISQELELDSVLVCIASHLLVEGYDGMCNLHLTPIPLHAIRATPHDPTWREKVNRFRPPPRGVVPPSGLEDAEHDYESSPPGHAASSAPSLLSPELLPAGMRRMLH
ncbi:hypothetical protein EIP91_009504 [Steccherinum ochraceum]|uniref:Uncharacterized protein n=1 Tax=Steccherinum ochraceum TaxID=92696 RepID=A0A4R0RED2_9APHY|nr:hypothetical protein EIP91_009504 [Steccherinum ochraceum]